MYWQNIFSVFSIKKIVKTTTRVLTFSGKNKKDDVWSDKEEVELKISDDEAEVIPLAKTKKTKKNKKKQQDSDSESVDDIPVPVSKSGKKNKKVESDEELDENLPKPVKKGGRKKNKNQEALDELEGEGDLTEDSEEEEIGKPVEENVKKNKEINGDDSQDLGFKEHVPVFSKTDGKKGNKQGTKSKKSKIIENDHVVGGDMMENGEIDSSEESKPDQDEELSHKLALADISEDKQGDKKLTHKEKKKMKKQQEYEKQMEAMLKKGGQGHSELDSNFTVSQVQKTAGQMAALENAVDIKIENFSISAKGNDLFVNANLLIAQGRHYGLVGPNGWEKSSLYMMW